MVRRILGQDFAPTTARTIQQVGTEVGRQQNFLQSGLQFADRTGQGISQSALAGLQSTRELANTQANIAARNQQRLASGGVGGILGGITDLVGGLSQFEQNRIQAALALQKSQGKRELALATQELEQHISGGNEFMLQQGPGNFEKSGLRILEKYPNISPTDVIPLTKSLYGKLDSYKTAQSKKLAESVEQIAKHRLDVVKADAATRATGILQQIENNPELATTKLKELDNLINTVKEENPQLTLPEIVELETGLVTVGLERLQKGTTAYNAMVAKKNNLNTFVAGYAQILKEFPNEPLTQAVKVNELALETGVTEAVKNEIINPKTLLEQQNDMLRIRKENQALKNSIYEIQVSERELDRDLQKQLAYGMVLDEDLKAEIMGTPFKNDPNFQIAVQQAKRIKDYYDAKADIDEKVDQIKQQKLIYSQRMNAFIGGQGTKNDLTALQELSRIMRGDGLNNTQATQQDNEVQTKSTDALFGTDVAERTKAQAEWRALKTQIEETYDDAITQYRQRLTSLQRGVAKFNLPDTLTKFDYEKIQQENINKINEATAILTNTPRDQGVGTGTRVNFNNGDVNKFATLKTDLGEIIVPFPAGTKGIRITSKFAEPRTKGPHKGLDFGAPMGTPLTSLVKGKVTQSRPETDGAGNLKGYGYFVDITDDATGVIYRYAHLQEHSPLKVGDVVGVGDPIGKVGSTGTSTGPHLDLSIWRNPKQIYGQGNSEDPVPLLRALLVNSQQKSDPPPGDNLEQYRKDQGLTPSSVTPQVNVVGATDLVLPGNRTIKYNQIVEGDSIRPVKDVITEATPLVPRLAPYDKNGWGVSDNIGSYGYAFMERNQDFREKLNALANELQIPANWLADVIAYENGFDHKQSDVGSDQYGIANLSVREVTELAGADFEQYEEMSPTEQLAVVGDYIKYNVGKYGAVNNLGGLAAMFFAGEWGYEQYQQNGIKAFGNGRDGNNMTFTTYMDKLGAGAKRKYKIPGRNANLSFMAPIHTEYHEQCAICRAMRNSGSEIVPHHGLIG